MINNKILEYNLIKSTLKKIKINGFLYKKFIKLLQDIEKSIPCYNVNCRYIGNYKSNF